MSTTTVKQPKTAEPPYRRIERDLRERIAAGQWPAGTLLPSRRALAEEYGVALRTVERAVSDLLDSGLLRAEGRWGTYVMPQDGTDPAGQAVTGPSAPRPKTTLTLGILDTPSLITHRSRMDEYGWNDAAATQAEQRFAATGGRCLYFERFGDHSDPIPVAEAAESLWADGADALIVLGLFDWPEMIAEVNAALALAARPVVYLTHEDTATDLPHVFFDNGAAGSQAANHLLHAGWKTLAFYSPLRNPWTERRYAGAQRAADAAGAPLSSLCQDVLTTHSTKDKEWCQAQAVRAAERLAAGECGERPGVIAVNDLFAMSLLEAAAQRGLEPSRDFGLIGFDNHPASRALGLTTQRPPLEAMGEEAVRLILKIAEGDRTGLQIRLRPHVLPRASTRRS